MYGCRTDGRMGVGAHAHDVDSGRSGAVRRRPSHHGLLLLGSVRDTARGQEKHHWLWTTIPARLQPYHFDGFRVFVYSIRRHRYETAYIERNVRGYHPVEVHPVAGSEMAQFSLTFAGKDGVLSKRTYEFQGFRYGSSRRPRGRYRWRRPRRWESPRPRSRSRRRLRLRWLSPAVEVERVVRPLGREHGRPKFPPRPRPPRGAKGFQTSPRRAMRGTRFAPSPLRVIHV